MKENTENQKGMNTMKNCNINYINNTIELTKKFAKAAGVLNSPEYNELLAIRRDYPTLPIVIREIKRKAGKKTYKNLTIAKMREYIVDWEGKDSEAVKQFDKVVALSKVQAGPYAYVKKWFLDHYTDKLEEFTVKEENADSENNEVEGQESKPQLEMVG